MIKINQLAIFMNEANALLMELYNHIIVSTSRVFKAEDIQSMYGEPLPWTDKQWHHLAYYKEISDIMRNYRQVVLFGPIDTRKELYKLLEADHHFKNIEIDFFDTHKMTDLQIHDFALDYYK
jgi:predicted metal-binding protein